MKIRVLVGVVQIVLFLSCTRAARFLGIFPMPAGSHYLLAEKLMKGLAAAGHHVTMVSPFPTKNLPANASWDNIVLEGVAEQFFEQFKKINMFEDSGRGPIERAVGFQYLMEHWLNTTLYHPEVRALLKPEVKFDAVILEQFYNNAHKYFAHYFDCQLVLMSSIGATGWVNDIVANPSPPSYIPNSFSIHDFDYQNFWSRFYNVYICVCQWITEYLYLDPYHDRILQKAFPGAPPVAEYNKRVSLILLNSHESLLEPVPTVPSMVQIGGYHIEPPKRLPADLQAFLDDASEGVIYFSMGGNIKSKDMLPEKKRTFFNVFGRLEQKVLWKYEDENDPDIPKNVLVRKWLPQTDVLAHPNVKLFITHGGMLSTTETIYHGKPVLAIPVFFDQFANARKAVRNGFGLQLPYNDETFSEETLGGLIRELLTDRKYAENARRRSNIFHDRPLKPLESLVYWVEYVLRHEGAPHLRVAGVNLPLYKYFMLDVIFTLLIIVSLAVVIIKYIVKRLLGKIRQKSKQKVL